jgi:hypothetical protein
MTVADQTQSSYLTRQPGQYNGMDISVGQWIGNLVTGQVWQIISVTAQSATAVTVTVEDIDRYNTFRDPSGTGNGTPNSGYYVVFTVSIMMDLPLD